MRGEEEIIISVLQKKTGGGRGGGKIAPFVKLSLSLFYRIFSEEKKTFLVVVVGTCAM